MRNGLTYKLMAVLTALLLNGCEKDDGPGTVMHFPNSVTGLNSDHASRIHCDSKGGVYVYQGYLAYSFDFRVLYYDGNWTSTDMSVQGVRHMAADDAGNMWALAWDLLYRFKDGHLEETRLIPSTPSPENFFVSLAYHGGSLWMLHSEHGLYEYDIETRYLTHHPDGNGPGGYRMMTVSSVGNVWVYRTGDGPCILYRTSSGNWHSPSFTSDIFITHWFSEMHPGPGQEVYMLSQAGILRVSELLSGLEVFDYSDYGPDLRFNRMTVDRALQPWFYSSGYLKNGLLAQRDASHRLYTVADLNKALNTDSVEAHHLAFDRNNNAWIATNKGVVVYNREGIRF